MPVTVLDPTYEEAPRASALAPRIYSPAGATIGIISNGKAGTVRFFDHLERLLREQWKVADVIRRTKGNYSAPADRPLIDEAATWQVMFAGIGD